MSRPKLGASAVLWLAVRLLPPFSAPARDEWRIAGYEAQQLAEKPGKRLLIGDGALRVHAVVELLSFTAVCLQPVGSVKGGTRSEVSCWTCRVLVRWAGWLARRAGDQR